MQSAVVPSLPDFYAERKKKKSKKKNDQSVRPDEGTLLVARTKNITHHQNAHFLLGKEALEQFRERDPHTF
jgi:hypothetical protein